MDLPEGLILTSVQDDTLIIHDAQDVVWVTFEVGGNGDPTRWERAIVERTCRALDVTEAFNNDADDFQPLDQFLDAYYGAKPDFRGDA